MHTAKIAGISVEVDRKNIKNLHLSVHPPLGRVRIAVPRHVTDDAIRLAVINKLGWIKRQQKRFAEQARQDVRRYVSGETHYFFGQKYRLQAIPGGRYSLEFRGKGRLDFHVRDGSETHHREAFFYDQCREMLKQELEPLVEKWSQTLGVRATDWQVRRMKTKWGSCTPRTGRILFNLELVKKSHRCIEYIVVHELIHLIERNHGDRFVALMDKYLPNWKACRVELNEAPLASENWEY
ncbi:SprT family zinc-dependent metalloprotease [Herbaspirillum sp.]|uniref:M48 family metallopeptidase n=1 Tax=Herbaspirillum sp. TaxID=1890675 RepID=UPI000C094B4C|nr:SprT family zinc-dependent metalloprotease [Herbaspirillum sp.]MAF01920.1 metal-dependent hydrolase [Herbaspirillum sp.]MBO17976.1 metal-dependent hydrolase [Herbaspirillum sp.]